ncbi:hypothetical protein MKEN_00749800 [Mycena kentingensis (nom. inval.)]|nr:hypothetical protein MKEN_00749800 [Mycena kentingensis (nom. inval.)]
MAAPSQTQPLLAGSPPPPQYDAIPVPYAVYQPARQRRRCCGCCSWTCCCVLFLATLLVFGGLVALVLLWPSPPTVIDGIADAIPPAFQAKSCLSGQPSTTIRSYTFALPVYNHTAVVVSRYALARNADAVLGGTLHITTSSSLPADTVHVIVAPASLGGATVCSLVPRNEGDTGTAAFGVFATGSARSVNLTLILPAQRLLRGLQTTLPGFAYDVDDLVGAGVQLRTAFITGGEKPIAVKSISAEDRLILSTWNASVSAEYAHSASLDVSTGSIPSLSGTHTNASIHGTFSGTWLRLITANSPIDARILPSSSSSSGDGDGDGDARMIVDAYTRNASLALTVLPSSTPTPGEEEEPRLHLRLRAITASAPASVRLPRAYEGTFRLAGDSVRVRLPRGEDARKVEFYYEGPAVMEEVGVDGDEEGAVAEIAGDDDEVRGGVADEVDAEGEGRVLTGAVYRTDEGIERGWVSVVAERGAARVVL